MSADARLRALVSRWDLGPDAERGLVALLDLLEGDEHAPTPIRDAERAVDVHVADSLAALALPEVRASRVACDLGSGAGFPGLALALALPDVRMALVESVGRKCRFLERAVEELGRPHIEVVCARAESWDDGRGRHDLVCARALAPLNVLVEYAAPLLHEGGVLVAWKGAPAAGEERDGAAAADLLGLHPERSAPVRPYEGADRRRLYVYRKVRETPASYPRRPGMARKRPLRASGRG